jgi:rhodanese-related sulfurtransferase
MMLPLQETGGDTLMIKAKRMATAVLISALALSVNPAVADKPVGITSKMMDAEVVHDGKKVKITRNQDNRNTVNPSFSKTSRPCPPFCVQPAIVAPGVETVGELEVIDYLKKMAAGDDSILVIDSRTPDWVKKGTIPGAVNIPWTKLNPAKGADPLTIGEILQEQFNVKESEGLWNFNDAKTLVMFCNGMWCGQSPNNIENLLKFGYPAHKLKWYRGGMQDWEILGLSTIPGK